MRLERTPSGATTDIRSRNWTSVFEAGVNEAAVLYTKLWPQAEITPSQLPLFCRGVPSSPSKLQASTTTTKYITTRLTTFTMPFATLNQSMRHNVLIPCDYTQYSRLSEIDSSAFTHPASSNGRRLECGETRRTVLPIHTVTPI